MSMDRAPEAQYETLTRYAYKQPLSQNHARRGYAGRKVESDKSIRG